MKKIFGSILFFLSITLLIGSFKIFLTGAVIGTKIVGNLLMQILGFVFLISSLLILSEKNGLEYLVIPTGWEESRIKKAKEEIEKKNFDKVIITGNASGWAHRNKIYHAIRKSGVPKEKVEILLGKDSEEDVLYLGNLLNSGDKVYFDTFPAHYTNYKQLIKKAKNEKKFPKGIELRLSKINQNGFMEKLYNVKNLLGFFSSRDLDYKQNRDPSKLDKLKSWIKRKNNSGYNAKD